MPPLTIYALILLLTTSAYAQLTPWDNQIFDFGWSPYDPTIVRCSTIQVGWNDRATANPHSQGPYVINALYGGSVPFQIASVTGTTYNWTVQLPTGGPYVLTMKDAQGYTGGDSEVFNVVDATSGTCGTNQLTGNTLQVSSSSTLAECSAITLTVQGGSAPYTMQILAGERPPKTTTWTTSTMSYTIDIKPTEQFFVLVTDANGNTALDGIHTVVSGDESCYNVATTVAAGSLPTTLSYDPSSTNSLPATRTSQTNAQSHSTTLLVQNTATATITSVVVLPDGSSSTYTLAPGSAVTVIAADTNGTSKSSTNLPAIVGGAVGGTALIILIIIIIWMQRRMAAQKRLLKQREEYERRRLSGGTLPMAATHVQPFIQHPNPSPNRESAPLMTHMGSTYSSGIPSVVTPAPSGDSYFGHGAGPAPWANPDVNYHQSNMYSPPPHLMGSMSPNPSSPPMSITSLPTSSGADAIPPGAMAPMIGTSTGPAKAIRRPSEGIPEKASFTPAQPLVAAPPPYSQR